MADLAKLVVNMEAENGKLLSKLEQSNKKLKKFETRANKVGKALKEIGKVGAVAFTAAIGALTALIDKTITANDKIAKMSVSTGLSVEQLSRLQHQTDLTGTSFEVIGKAVGKFQRAMFDASNGLVTYQEAFADLDISVVDSNGALRDTNEVLLDVADKFSQMENGARKSALAQILVGKAGRELIPLLNSGRAGMQAMADEADRLGLTLDSKTAKASENVKDNMTRLKTSFDGVLLKVTTGLLPMIEKASDAMVVWSQETGNVEGAIDFLTNSMKVTISAGLLLKGVLKSVALAGASMAAAVVQAVQGNFSQAADIIKMGAEDSDKAWADAMDGIDKVWNKTSSEIAAKAPKIGKDIASPVKVGEGMVRESGKKILERLNKIKADIKKASDDLVNIGEEFQGRLDGLNSPTQKAAEDLTVLDVGSAQLDAEKALKAGDFDGAIDKARKAFDLLDKMKGAGTESELILSHFGEKLKEVAEKAQSEKLADITAQLEIDEPSSIENALAASNKMQDALTANPLTQTINVTTNGGVPANDAPGINPDLAPTRTPEPTSGRPYPDPVNLTLPNGNVIPMFADPRIIEQTRRDIQREALQKGTR